ncbi:RNA-binding domain-containing protein [Hesseltinella vesiculosa]|uniref:RNA-binding domain-containing protein n=1 Tax=Hesseltinella vesiculosa TaxID=101127 RepID=A0A1X2GN08_9FUNG|nr:RNA-binding domain-containing protein [Hesseltinella vesiculosa]
MSRLIVKNLPKDLTEDKFRTHFAKKGEVTDAKLMRTSSGHSRRFGFIGYRSPEAADAALKYFHGSFIHTSRIVVEKAIPVGSEGIPRPWSKYSEGSSANARITGSSTKTNEFKVEETAAFLEKKNGLLTHINKLKADEQDPKLREYLDVMTSRSKSKTWTNDDLATLTAYTKGNLDAETAAKVTATIAHNPEDDLYDDLPANDTADDVKEDEGEDLVDDADDAMDEDDLPERAKLIKAQEAQAEKPEDLIEDTGRLYIRNLPYSCTEQDLRDAFTSFGPLSEVHMPIAKDTKQAKGYAYIAYMLPEHAIKAYKALDMKEFQGRLLHVLPAKEKPVSKEEEIYGPNGTKISKVKKEKEQKRRNLAGNDFNWNSLYMSSDAIAESMADRLGVSKSEFLSADADNAAVRLALAETQIISETKEFFEEHGIVLDTFGKKERSDTVILIKNIPFGTTEDELKHLFGKHGDLGRVLIPPAKTMAVVEFLEPSEARRAFQGLAYRRFKDTVLYLEKGPKGMFKSAYKASSDVKEAKDTKSDQPSEDQPKKVSAADMLAIQSTEDDLSQVATLFVKNLNFQTTAADLQKAFSSISGYRSSRINVKRNAKDPKKPLSMGFGFVEFTNKDLADKALDAMQGYKLDGHALELKMSNHDANQKRKKGQDSRQPDTTKLVVRNVPFEATVKDLRELFSAYGQLKSLRLPKKFNGGHRGFAFLDFMTKQEAKNVFENMASIHLYGRHLVLEWASEDDGVEALREKTGKHYSKEQRMDTPYNKKRKIDLDNDEDQDMSD